MQPQFQSSFIPKGPVATTGTATRVSQGADRSLLGTLAVLVFVISVVLSVGVFGYEKYLDSRINAMNGDLAAARATLKPEVITDISRLDQRLVATQVLLNKHIVLSPLFDYLENATLKGVRFTEFQYLTTEQGLTLNMRGEAKGYAAVSLQAQVFNKSPYMKQPIFSDLDLDDKGNVTFSFKVKLDPSIVSYKKLVNDVPAVTQVLVPVSQPVTTVATTTTDKTTQKQTAASTTASTTKKTSQ
ncbi:hypothetical protein KW800_01725 [Candidatus Parcubacteria bacterium]|nr:hypothetical protein [Candidatus Parcubacteria bacterium]